jgi:MATE family multidrug resistance protein
VAALVIFGARTQIAAVYTQDAAVIAMGATLLLYAAAFQLSDGVQVVSNAALRGLKDTQRPMLLSAFAYWGIGMPLGAGLGFGLGWGAQGMWCGLIAGLTFAALLLAHRLQRQVNIPLPVAPDPS